MGLASEEEQRKRGVIFNSLLMAVLLSIPVLNILVGGLILFMWGMRILGASSNILKDLLILFSAIAVIALTCYGADYFGWDSKSDIFSWSIENFIVAWIAMFIVIKNVDAVND